MQRIPWLAKIPDPKLRSQMLNSFIPEVTYSRCRSFVARRNCVTSGFTGNTSPTSSYEIEIRTQRKTRLCLFHGTVLKFPMTSTSYVFIFIQLAFVLSRVIFSSASCTQDYDCFPSGGRKCCLGECSKRKYCSNYCDYNGDCDISKRENCIGNKCTTEVRTLQPGHCRYSYQCDTLTEICEGGKCKKIKGVNGATEIPKSDGGTNSGNSALPATVLVGITVPVVGIAIILIIIVCLVLRHKRQMRNHEANERLRHEREMQSLAVSRRPCPVPSAPPLPPYDTFRRGDPILQAPLAAPPSYDDVMKNTVSA